MANWGKFLEVTQPGRNDSKGTREARALVERLRVELFEQIAHAQRHPSKANGDYINEKSAELATARARLADEVILDERARQIWAAMAFPGDARRARRRPPPTPPPSAGHLIGTPGNSSGIASFVLAAIVLAVVVGFILLGAPPR